VSSMHETAAVVEEAVDVVVEVVAVTSRKEVMAMTGVDMTGAVTAVEIRTEVVVVVIVGVILTVEIVEVVVEEITIAEVEEAVVVIDMVEVEAVVVIIVVEAVVMTADTMEVDEWIEEDPIAIDVRLLHEDVQDLVAGPQGKGKCVGDFCGAACATLPWIDWPSTAQLKHRHPS